MDIIIYANSEVKKIIKEISLDENKKVSPDKFKEIIANISNGK